MSRSAPRPKGPRKTTEEAMRETPGAFMSPAELAAAKKAGDRAQARNPREVLDAFAPLPFKIAGLDLRPLTLGAFMVLERMESPFADEQLTAGALAEIKAEDIARMAFVLTRDPAEVLDLLAQGPAALDRAVVGFAAQIPAQELQALGTAIGRIIIVAFSTVVAGQKKTTPASSTPPPATASAGG